MWQQLPLGWLVEYASRDGECLLLRGLTSKGKPFALMLAVRSGP